MIYHVVSNDVGTILAVYGEALEQMARDFADAMVRSHGPVVLHTISCPDHPGQKPRVGYSISMKGTVGFGFEWIGAVRFEWVGESYVGMPA